MPMFFKSQYLDSTALSNRGVPLPASKSENILFFCQNVYFKISIRQVQGCSSSRSGVFYLTNIRIIYVPMEGASFKSFFLPLSQIFTVKQGIELGCHCDSGKVGVVIFNFKSSQSNFYFTEIFKAVRSIQATRTSDSDSDGSESLPYYSDICEIE